MSIQSLIVWKPFNKAYIMKNQFNKDELKLLVGVCLTLFTIPLTITSSSVFNLSIMLKYNVNYYQSQWFITLYMIFYASFMAVSGSFADIFGRNKIFITGLVLILLSFLAGAFTSRYILLLASRAICGIGAAAVTTSGTALLAANISGEKNNKAFSIFGCALGIGMVCGPLIAGYANQMINGWKIFSLSMSGLLLFILCLSFSVVDKRINVEVSVDWIGGILLTISLLLTVLALSFMPLWGYFDSKSLLCFFGGFIGFFILILFEKNNPNPNPIRERD